MTEGSKKGKQKQTGETQREGAAAAAVETEEEEEERDEETSGSDGKNEGGGGGGGGGGEPGGGGGEGEGGPGGEERRKSKKKKWANDFKLRALFGTVAYKTPGVAQKAPTRPSFSSSVREIDPAQCQCRFTLVAMQFPVPEISRVVCRMKAESNINIEAMSV